MGVESASWNDQSSFITVSNAGHSGSLHEGYSHMQAGVKGGRPHRQAWPLAGWRLPTLLLAGLLPLGPRARRFAARCFLFLWPLLGGLLPGWTPSQGRCRSAGSGLEAIDLPVQLHHQRLRRRERCGFHVRHVATIWLEFATIHFADPHATFFIHTLSATLSGIEEVY